MAHVLNMPRQGNTVESCVIIGWKVKEGDTVAADAVVCEVETDKASFEVTAPAAGIMLKILHAAGADVPVLQPIAVIGNAGEDWSAAIGTAPGTASETATAPATIAQTTGLAIKPSVNATENTTGSAIDNTTGSAIDKESGISPRARNLAAQNALDTSLLGGTGPEGRVIERDVKAALEGRPPLTAAAKAALASGAQVVLPEYGSGIGGRITASDLANAPQLSAGTASPRAQGVAASASAALGVYTDVQLKGIRKVIAERMAQSLANSAQFTLNSSASALRLQELRARFKASAENLGLTKVTINDLVLFAVSRLLKEFPFMNAHKLGDTVRTYESVHLGLAVDTPRGLMVPVIRNAETLSLGALSAEAKRLAAACQAGSIKAEALSGSSFTITNLGSLGIESFTPVLNAPEVAILGVCGIQPKPVFDAQNKNGGVSFVPHIGFSMTIDHQVVDGAPAARFLKALCDVVADLDVWMVK